MTEPIPDLFRNPYLAGRQADAPVLHRGFQDVQASLRAAIEAGGTFSLLTGELSTGKTTLLRELRAGLNKAALQTLVLSAPPTDPDDLFAACCRAAGIAAADVESQGPREALKSLADRLSAHGQAFLCLFDEAKPAAIPAIEELWRLLAETPEARARHTMVVAGKPDLESVWQTLQEIAPNQAASHVHRIEPLAQDEIVPFIDEMVKHGGHRTEDLFAEAAIRRLAEHSHGLPGTIDQLASFCLIHIWLEEEDKVSASIVDKAYESSFAMLDDEFLRRPVLQDEPQDSHEPVESIKTAPTDRTPLAKRHKASIADLPDEMTDQLLGGTAPASFGSDPEAIQPAGGGAPQFIGPPKRLFATRRHGRLIVAALVLLVAGLGTAGYLLYKAENSTRALVAQQTASASPSVVAQVDLVDEAASKPSASKTSIPSDTADQASVAETTAAAEMERLAAALGEAELARDAALAKVGEINGLRQALASAEEKIQTLTDQALSVREDLTERVAAATIAQKEVDRLSAELRATTAERDKVVAELADQRSLVEPVAADARADRLPTIATQTAVIGTSDAGEEITAARQEIERLTAALQQAESSRDAALADLQDARAEASVAAEAAATARQEVARLSAALEEAEAGRQAALAEAVSLGESLASAEQDNQALRQAVNNARSDAASEAQTGAAARQETERLSIALQEMEAARDSATTELAELEEALSTTSQERQDLALSLESARNDATTANESVASAELEIARLSEALTAAENERDTARKEVDRLTPLRDSLASAEQGNLTLANDVATARAEADSLRASIAADAQIIESLVSALQEAEVERDGALAEASELPALRESLGAAQEEAQSLTAALEGAKSEAEDAARSVEEAREENQRLSTALEEAETARDTARAEAAELAALREALATAEAERTAAASDAESLSAEIAGLRESNAEAGREIERLSNELLEAESRLEASEADAATLPQLREAPAASEQESQSLASERDELRASVEAARSEAARAGNDVAAAQQEIERLSAALKIAEADLETRASTVVAAASAAAPQPPEGSAQAQTPEPPVERQSTAPESRIASVTTPSGAGDDLITEGDEYFVRGDLATARLYYELSLDQGNPRAATAMGRTFDPEALRQLGIVGLRGNPDRALAWYQRGRDAGDEAAQDLLERLLATRQAN